MTQEQKDNLNFDIRCFFTETLDNKKVIDEATIAKCMEENNASLYNTEQILFFLEEDKIIKEVGGKYVPFTLQN